MSIFDRFKSKLRDPRGLAEINVTFTADESEAIRRALERHATVANAHAPEGMEMFVPPKVRDGIAAQGLAEYAEDLIREIQNCDSDTTITTLADKAIKAQMTAYAVHNLPIYLFQLAGMLEAVGDTAKGREFFRHFLRAQGEFKPDQIDALFLGQMGPDSTTLVTVAKEKVSQSERHNEYDDPRSAAKMPPLEMDPSTGARILYFEVVKAEADRLKPAEFELPDSVADDFKVVASFYLEASMLLALQNTDLAVILREFEKLMVVGLDEPEQARYNTHIAGAVEELKLLNSEENYDWCKDGFARRWFARVGVVSEPGPFSSLRLTVTGRTCRLLCTEQSSD